MKVSIVIPVFNEKSTIEEIIRRIKAVNLDKGILITDDCSTDGTREILKEKFLNESDIKVIFLDKNMGKGFALRQALPFVTGDVVIIQDADLEYDPEDYFKLLEPMEKGEMVVYGSRFIHLNPFFYLSKWLESKIKRKECKIGHLYASNFLGIQLLNIMVALLYWQKITDEATCYKAFRKEVIDKIDLKCMGFEFCPEITAKVCKAGYKIKEVPISYNPRTTEHGKKVSWKDGIVAILVLLKYRFRD